MNKIFHSYVKKFQLFPKSGIYDEYSKKRISEFNKHNATLYFFVKTPKIRIIPSSFRVADNFQIRGQFSIDGHVTDIAFDAAEAQFDNPKIQENFENVEAFKNHCMTQWEFPAVKKISNSMKYKIITSIDLEKSSERYIHINCALGHAISGGEGGQVILTPYQLINLFDFDCLRKLEVIYVGRSNDDTWNRVYNHNKWGLIEEYRESRDEMLIYFLQLDKSFVNLSRSQGTTMIYRDESELSIGEATSATESALIKYFIRKKLFNIEHVNSDIKTTKVVREALRPAGYTNIVVEVYLEGPFGFLGSEAVESSDYHRIEYEI